MALSTFILVLWVLLVSMSQIMLGWFNFDVRFLGFVGFIFAVVVALESLSILPATILRRRA